MSQFPVISNVPEYDELRVGAGAHGHLFNDHRGWPTAPDPAPVLQYPSSVPENDGPHLKPLIFHPCNHLPSNSLPDNPQLCHVDVHPTNATACFFNAEDPFLYYYHDQLEGASLASNPSRFGQALSSGRRSPLHTEGSSPPQYSSSFGARMTLSRTPGENNVNTDACREFSPIQDDRHSIYSGDISWVVPDHNESGDFDTLLAAAVSQGLMRDKCAIVTSLGMSSMYPTSPGQPTVAINSTILPTNRSSNHYSPTSPDSDHGNGPAASNFRSESQGRQHNATVSLIASSRASEARRHPKKYWCRTCNVGFSQKQGLRRHNKDAHFSRLLCPYCEDFEWSPGRKYIFKKHLKAKHPEVTPEDTALNLQRQDPRGSRRACGSLKSSNSSPFTHTNGLHSHGTDLPCAHA
ncbi:hypothetical protein EDB92DRAFT_660762 [Lactarius akahatsu]|uniref:C2H2-type domain-containing protein n=1 Tax=Lactarius akahatsu TaxID=416441 RepID=A0AAD4LLA0_9AGAM|nr:hypothetical protein EDB92DRAFT_660762 [Lactarius akahatsu]